MGMPKPCQSRAKVDNGQVSPTILNKKKKKEEGLGEKRTIAVGTTSHVIVDGQQTSELLPSSSYLDIKYSQPCQARSLFTIFVRRSTRTKFISRRLQQRMCEMEWAPKACLSCLLTG